MDYATPGCTALHGRLETPTEPWLCYYHVAPGLAPPGPPFPICGLGIMVPSLSCGEVERKHSLSFGDLEGLTRKVG